MRTYVLGAGASYPIYPLGGSLLEHIDGFIKSCGKCFDRFDYEKEWPVTLEWLASNRDPLLRKAYRAGNIEQIFTVLDLAQSLYEGSLDAIWHVRKNGDAAVSSAEASYESLKAELSAYRETQKKLETGDVIVTFNYDSTLERVLFEQGKWSPKDGYGTDLVFQRDRHDSNAC